LILTAVGYFSFFKAPENIIYVMDSKLRGKTILMPGKWGIYPESLIPAIFKIKKMSISMPLQSEMKMTLPYSEILEYLGLSTVQVSFSGNYQWTKDNISTLYYQTPEEIKERTQQKISSTLQKIIVRNLDNPDFSQNAFLEQAAKAFQEEKMNIQLRIIVFPSWNDYYALSTRLKSSIQQNASQILANLSGGYYQKIMIQKQTQKKIEAYFQTATKMAGQISKSGQQDLILKLLDYMKNLEQ
jgi:hypothetical protein